MNHADHVQLIEAGIERNSGGIWADFGAGSGAFTLALRDIAGPDIDLIAIDRDRASLQTLRATMERRFPGTRLRLLEADIAGHLTLAAPRRHRGRQCHPLRSSGIRRRSCAGGRNYLQAGRAV